MSHSAILRSRHWPSLTSCLCIPSHVGIAASKLACVCRRSLDERRPCRRREVAAGSATFPPPDRSGASPPVGPLESLRALTPGQPQSSHRWHPCCRRCLLKGCECWFLPPWPQARYCSPACREAAEHWRSWHAGQTYRATIQGKERRREQARRHRERQRLRSVLAEPVASTLPIEPVAPTLPIEPAAPALPIEPVTPALPIEPAAPTLPIEPVLPVIEAQATSDSLPIIPTAAPSVGQRPAEILPKSCGLPCSRPGCYVLFLPSPRSPDQHFCSGSCRQALRRVRQREARLRHRRQRGILGRYLRHRGPPPSHLGHVAAY